MHTHVLGYGSALANLGEIANSSAKLSIANCTSYSSASINILTLEFLAYPIYLKT